ncbi:MAG TPA: copper chaperone PCu(A)C [Alphaproteobacteria bacterium]|nr:copper chaperone PCu(A)C [Alphaproteobacteria bacterium]
MSTSAGAARAHDTRQGDLHIGHSWTKPAPAGGIAEVYFAIINRGTRPDRLVGAESRIAARAGLAETIGESVAPRAAIELPAGRPVALRPGRFHIRLEGLREALQQGRDFPLTLRFAASPPLEIVVLVELALGH